MIYRNFFPKTFNLSRRLKSNFAGNQRLMITRMTRLMCWPLSATLPHLILRLTLVQRLAAMPQTRAIICHYSHQTIYLCYVSSQALFCTCKFSSPHTDTQSEMQGYFWGYFLGEKSESVATTTANYCSISWIWLKIFVVINVCMPYIHILNCSR